MSLEFTADRAERLDKALARWVPDHSRSKLAKLIEAGHVRVNDQSAKPGQPLRVNDRVVLSELPTTEAHDLTPADIPLDIRFEDEHLLVVNKPRGLAVHPASTLKEPSLVNALLGRATPLSQAGGSFRPGIVHRLDKETTGLLVVAKTDQVHVALARQVASKSAIRRYVAIVNGSLERDAFTIEAGIARSKVNRILMAIDVNGKRAVTHVRRLQEVSAGTLIACQLETGRTHQIRVHLSAVNLPIVGDALYSPKSLRTAPMQLHSAVLEFTHPVTKERVVTEAAPPSDFLADVPHPLALTESLFMLPGSG